jgi:hypothetical protein
MMFRLKKYWFIDGVQCNLWNEIVSGRKTEEFREATPYWWKRLLGHDYNSFWSQATIADAQKRHMNFVLNVFEYSFIPKVATFTVGYPRNNLPRIEAEIKYVKYLWATNQLAVGIANVRVIE